MYIFVIECVVFCFHAKTVDIMHTVRSVQFTLGPILQIIRHSGNEHVLHTCAQGRWHGGSAFYQMEIVLFAL